MKFSAVFFLICAAAMPARAERDLNWPPAVIPGTPGAVTVPAPSRPARALPKDGVNYSAAEEILIKEFGVTGINLDMPEAQIGAQINNNPGGLSPEQALRFALNSFLTDYSDRTSPLAGILSGMGASKPTRAQLKLAAAYLIQLMNMPGSSLRLVWEGGPKQAARGEKVYDNWIFNLRLSGYDYSYWAVAGRSGNNPVYNYGGN